MAGPLERPEGEFSGGFFLTMSHCALSLGREEDAGSSETATRFASSELSGLR